MLRSAGYCDVQHSHGQGAVAAHQPVQQSRWQETIRHMLVTGPGFGSGVLSSFVSRRSPFAAIRADRVRRFSSSSRDNRIRSARPFHDLGSYFADGSHAVGALPLLRNPFFQRQHHLIGVRCAALHHQILSSSFTRWINKCQQARTKNWEISPKAKRAK